MNLPRLFFSHYVYNGVGGAIGVFLAGIIGYFFGGWDFVALMSTGAVVVHLVDAPCPPRRKLLQVVPILLASLLVSLLVLACHSLWWWQLACVVMVSLFAATLSAFGKAALPYSFSLLYAMMMGIAFSTPTLDWAHIINYLFLFACGGGFYIVYVQIKEYVLELRSKQQVLAECLHDFATYLELKSELFNTNNYAEQINLCVQQIIRQQVALTEKFQDSRDIIFRHVASKNGGYLSASLFALFDAYEISLSNHAKLIPHLSSAKNRALLNTIGKLVASCAENLNNLAKNMMRNTLPNTMPDYKEQLDLAEQQIAALQLYPSNGASVTFFSELLKKIKITLEHINEIYKTAFPQSSSPIENQLELDQNALNSFLSPRLLRFSALRHISSNPSAIRYIFRMTLAMAIGFAIARVLPYDAHGYWVMLTISVILRSNYSQTKKRGTDQVIGTIIGCILAAMILLFLDYHFLMLIFLFIAVAVSRAMVNVRYRYTAAAATIMGVTQIHMLVPDSHFLIGERLIDTLIGAALAYIFSFVLPNWEHRSILPQTKNLANSCIKYARQALIFNPSPIDYRLARRRFHDELALFSQATERMLDEPKSQQLPVAPLHDTTTNGFRLAAHLAAVHQLLTKQSKQLDKVQSDAQLEKTCQQVKYIIEQANCNKPIYKSVASSGFLANSKQLNLSDIFAYRLETIRVESIQFAASLKKVIKSHRRRKGSG